MTEKSVRERGKSFRESKSVRERKQVTVNEAKAIGRQVRITKRQVRITERQVRITERQVSIVVVFKRIVL